MEVFYSRQGESLARGVALGYYRIRRILFKGGCRWGFFYPRITGLEGLFLRVDVLGGCRWGGFFIGAPNVIRHCSAFRWRDFLSADYRIGRILFKDGCRWGGFFIGAPNVIRHCSAFILREFLSADERRLA